MRHPSLKKEKLEPRIAPILVLGFCGGGGHNSYGPADDGPGSKGNDGEGPHEVEKPS